eukprot:15452828-Alexandrium_andersonii.AAC.1
MGWNERRLPRACLSMGKLTSGPSALQASREPVPMGTYSQLGSFKRCLAVSAHDMSSQILAARSAQC